MSLEKHGSLLPVGADFPLLKSYLMFRSIDFNMFLDAAIKDTTISKEKMREDIANYRAVSLFTSWESFFVVN